MIAIIGTDSAKNNRLEALTRGPTPQTKEDKIIKQAGAELCQAQASLDMAGFDLIFWILQVWFSLKDLV